MGINPKTRKNILFLNCKFSQFPDFSTNAQALLIDIGIYGKITMKSTS